MLVNVAVLFRIVRISVDIWKLPASFGPLKWPRSTSNAIETYFTLTSLTAGHLRRCKL